MGSDPKRVVRSIATLRTDYAGNMTVAGKHFGGVDFTCDLKVKKSDQIL